MKRFSVVVVLALILCMATSVHAIRVETSLVDFPPPTILSLDGVDIPDNSKDAVLDDSVGELSDETESGDNSDSSDESTDESESGEAGELEDEIPAEFEQGAEDEFPEEQPDGLELNAEISEDEESEINTAEEIQKIRLYLEIGLFLFVPFLLAIVAIILLFVWSYRTFLR